MHFVAEKGSVLLIADFFTFLNSVEQVYKTLNMPVDPLQFVGWRETLLNCHLDRSHCADSSSNRHPRQASV